MSTNLPQSPFLDQSLPFHRMSNATTKSPMSLSPTQRPQPPTSPITIATLTPTKSAKRKRTNKEEIATGTNARESYYLSGSGDESDVSSGLVEEEEGKTEKSTVSIQTQTPPIKPKSVGVGSTHRPPHHRRHRRRRLDLDTATMTATQTVPTRNDSPESSGGMGDDEGGSQLTSSDHSQPPQSASIVHLRTLIEEVPLSAVASMEVRFNVTEPPSEPILEEEEEVTMKDMATDPPHEFNGLEYEADEDDLPWTQIERAIEHEQLYESSDESEEEMEVDEKTTEVDIPPSSLPLLSPSLVDRYGISRILAHKLVDGAYHYLVHWELVERAPKCDGYESEPDVLPDEWISGLALRGNEALKEYRMKMQL